MKKFLLFLAIFVLTIQHCIIWHQHRQLNQWAALQHTWREKLDTCMERNARIYEELYNLQEYKIMKLKEQGTLK